jgi:RNA polymerase sigma factor (sigma-70 family)
MAVNMVDIWDRFRQKDDGAFQTLFETYADVLYGYGRKFVSDGDFVRDCIQDLFVKLYSHRASLSPTANPKFYLLLSLKNTIIDALVKARKLTYVSPENLPFLAVEYYMFEGDSAEEAETGKILKKAMSVLNARQKEAIYLRFQQELSYEEVSELLGINYQSARNLIHRSITKIREAADLPEYETKKV